MIKQEKPLSLDRGSLVGTGRELVLHERNRKKREIQSDSFVRNLSKQLPTTVNRSHCTARRNLNDYFEKDFTFSPKLNEQSIKLAKERTARLITSDDDNIKEFSKNSELQKLYTFKPTVSPASVRIVQNLGTTFLARQQLHIERKQKLLEEAQRIPIPLLHRPKKNSKLIMSSSEASPENPYKLFATESNNEESERLHLPPCPSTPTLTQQNSVEEMTPQPSLLQSSVIVSDPSDVEKNQTAKVSDSLVFSPVLHSHSSHKSLTRSTTVSQMSVKLQTDRKRSPICRHKYPSFNGDQEIFRFKRLKVKAESVMRSKKVFVVQGPYRSVRSSMRRRGWVEQSYRGPLGDQDISIITKSPVKKTVKPKADKAKSAVDSSSDDSDDTSSSSNEDLDSDSEHSDEEDYCFMSRAVRNSLPFFIWTCRRDDFLCRNLRKVK